MYVSEGSRLISVIDIQQLEWPAAAEPACSIRTEKLNFLLLSRFSILFVILSSVAAMSIATDASYNE